MTHRYTNTPLPHSGRIVKAYVPGFGWCICEDCDKLPIYPPQEHPKVVIPEPPSKRVLNIVFVVLCVCLGLVYVRIMYNDWHRYSGMTLVGLLIISLGALVGVGLLIYWKLKEI